MTKTHALKLSNYLRNLLKANTFILLVFLIGCSAEAPTATSTGVIQVDSTDSRPGIATETNTAPTPTDSPTETSIPVPETIAVTATTVPATPTMAITLDALSYTQIHTEQLVFQTEGFYLVGDLQIPVNGEFHPVIIMVHGSGDSNREDYGRYRPIMDRFLSAGYAVFSWDKPGTGESSGQLSYYADVISQRAAILLEAIEVMKAHPSIDPHAIGVWGISQAGYVIPMTMTMTDDIAFIILISGPAMDSYDQGAYLIGQVAYCFGSSQEEADVIEELISNVEKANTYREYLENVERLNEHLSDADFGLSRDVIPESEWEPEDVKGLAFFNPIEVIEQTTIPVLAIFGELDRQVDPVQGSQAFSQALQEAGNPLTRVELIPGVDHVIVKTETGCFDEQANYSRAQLLGYPDEYLDLLETWVRQIMDSQE